MSFSSNYEETAATRLPITEHGEESGKRAGHYAESEPRLVIRGETLHTDTQAKPHLAFIDWIGFTVLPPQGRDLQWVADCLEHLFGIERECWQTRGGGWNGYSNRVALGDWGLLGHGGASQRGTIHVSLNGHACARVQDWNAVKVWGETYTASITRVDLAHDDFAGANVNIETGLHWYREGGFTNAGRPPVAELRDDLGSGKGKTLYIGNRANGKYLRIYEKGRQLGDPSSPWVRAELELHNQSRVIPWDVLTRPDPYLSGAYPALRWLSDEQSPIKTTHNAVSISFACMVENLRTMGGKAIRVMAEAYGGDCGEVVARLARPGRPKRLVGYPDDAIAGLDDLTP